jgi:hypothetical protein
MAESLRSPIGSSRRSQMQLFERKCINLLRPGWPHVTYLLNFQPYIGAWSGNPLAPPLFNSYTYADVLADLQTAKATRARSRR